MNAILLVLGADVFKKIAAAIPPGDAHGFASGMVGCVEPGPLVDADGIDDQPLGLERDAFP